MNCFTAFIASLKVRKFHYSLVKSDKVNMSKDMNIEDLHNMYTEKHLGNSVSYEKFSIIQHFFLLPQD